MHIFHRQSQGGGFTLIEMLVVVILLAVLAMLAVPSYQGAIRKSRRAEGKTLLQMVMAAEERYYSRANRYTDAATELGFGAIVESEPGGHYALTQVSVDDQAQRVAITVSPRLAQSGDVCANLTLDSLGRRSASGQGGNASDCW